MKLAEETTSMLSVISSATQQLIYFLPRKRYTRKSIRNTSLYKNRRNAVKAPSALSLPRNAERKPESVAHAFYGSGAKIIPVNSGLLC